MSGFKYAVGLSGDVLSVMPLMQKNEKINISMNEEEEVIRSWHRLVAYKWAPKILKNNEDFTEALAKPKQVASHNQVLISHRIC